MVGLDDIQVAYPWTIYLITYMVGQFFAAWVGRHVESRRVLAWGMSIAAACNLALGFLVDHGQASAYFWMCVTMGIHGLAQATGWPHNVALFANWTRRAERGTLFGIWGTCYQFGAVFGKGLAGFLLGWLGLAWTFYGSSLVLLAFTAYFALRAGAEEVLLPGQHGLRDWALATPLSCGRVLRGYLLGQLVHSLYLLALSSPLVVVSFTVSGGEWIALAWCLAALLVQAMFYRLCGAITHLTIGQHRGESYFAVRAILLLIYVPVGWLVPLTSHIAFTSHALGESPATQLELASVPDAWEFLVVYAGMSVLATIVLHRLLARARRGMAGPQSGANVGAAFAS